MVDLRKLAEAATPGPWRFPSRAVKNVVDIAPPHSFVVVYCKDEEAERRQREADAAFIAAANPQAVIGLLDERDAYRAFAVSVARMVASPGAEDTADDLEALDLGALEDVVRAEYGNGRASGDRARFAHCAEDLARALGLDVRRAPEWGEMMGRVRDVVRRADVAAERWKWSGVFVLPDARGLWFTAPGAKSDTLVAVIQPRDDGMLSVKVNGQKRTAADDLPAALATIRAVLGADVPEIPNERSEL